jgi:hypothetical protein
VDVNTFLPNTLKSLIGLPNTTLVSGEWVCDP